MDTGVLSYSTMPVGTWPPRQVDAVEAEDTEAEHLRKSMETRWHHECSLLMNMVSIDLFVCQVGYIAYPNKTKCSLS